MDEEACVISAHDQGPEQLHKLHFEYQLSQKAYSSELPTLKTPLSSVVHSKYHPFLKQAVMIKRCHLHHGRETLKAQSKV